MKRNRLCKLLVIMTVITLLILISLNAYIGRMRFVRIPEDDENLGIKKQELQQDSIIEKNKLMIEEPKKDDNKEPKKDDNDVKNGNNAKKDNAGKDNKGINRGEERINEKILNIVLLGGDRRYKNDCSHTDAIIVLTIDTTYEKIKISSIMRDTYVKVRGYGNTKINHAYVYGGPKLVIRTLNENFNLNIRDYVYIDFEGFEKLVDLLGGVEFEVKKYEIIETNKRIKEVADLKRVRPNYIRRPGMQLLKGEQALAYSRIRKVGNGDFERTERQRRVLAAIYKKINEIGPLKLPVVIAKVLPYAETSLSKTEIVKIGSFVITSKINTVEHRRFPMDGYCKGRFIDEVWYLVADLPATREQMRKFIYEKGDSAMGTNINPTYTQNPVYE